MVKRKLVSVLLPVYKEKEEYIETAIKSILCQTYKEIELIIMLDNPSVEKKEFLNKFASSNVRIICNESNLGIVNNLNKGLDFCTGDYICRMDADDYSYPTRIEEQVKFLEENNYGIVGCNIECFSDNEKYFVNYPQHNYDCMLMLFFSGCIAHPAWLVKKSVYLDLQGYRNVPYAEDLDFLLRCRNKCVTMGNLQKVLLKYRLNDEGISQKNKSKQQAIAMFLVKNSKNKVIDLKDIEYFLNSNKFKTNIKRIEKKQKLKEKQSLFAFLNFIYIKEKLIYIIKRCLLSKGIIKKCFSKMLNIFYSKSIYNFYNQEIIIKNEYKILLLGSADYCNIGDLAISEATLQKIKEINKNKILEVPLHSFNVNKKKINRVINHDTIIILQGGGNLGINYFEAEKNRRYILKKYRKNKIILFPCSIDYGNSKKALKELKKSQKIYNKCSDLSIFAREELSYKVMKDIYSNCKVKLCDDIVFYYMIEFEKQRKDIYGIGLRNDIESTSEKMNFDDFEYEIFDNVYFKNKIYINERKKIVDKQIEKIASYKAIITDRLHIMIFCFLTKTPCLAIDNTNHKVSKVYERIKDCGFIFMNIKVDDFIKIIENKEYQTNKIDFKDDYFIDSLK